MAAEAGGPCCECILQCEWVRVHGNIWWRDGSTVLNDLWLLEMDLISATDRLTRGCEPGCTTRR